MLDVATAVGDRPGGLDVTAAAALPVQQVATAVGSPDVGLTTAEALRRRGFVGPNAVRSHQARALPVLAAQLRSPLLVLLAVTALASFFLGEHLDALIIGVILAAAVGLGFCNEYRAARIAQALHSKIRHNCVVKRDGRSGTVDVTDLVPGDRIELEPGAVVPADIRLVTATGLECDESVLTGESAPVAKSTQPVAAASALAELADCALMGTVVSGGTATGIVVATGAGAQFGRMALALGERHSETEFQLGLRRFSLLLMRVAAVLTAAIFAANAILQRPIIDALLFSLAVAVGISPQLLPAVVSTSLALGTRHLARRKVLVKRLVCIEDLGNIEVLFTDKTGTLTENRVSFQNALGPDGVPVDKPLLLGLACTQTTVATDSGAASNALDAALWSAPAAAAVQPSARAYRRIATLPFDHQRRLMSVLVDDPAGDRVVITKGAPEAVLAACVDVPPSAGPVLQAQFADGKRVLAVAVRSAPGITDLATTDECGLTLCGFLVFLDPPKASVPAALRRLANLGVQVKVVTGDSPVVARHLCRAIGLEAEQVLAGPDIEGMDDAKLSAAVAATTVFARVSPEQKARIVRARRRTGVDVAFLGDGVNDALALHEADVGISVESATDVAKDSADVILLDKDLDVLADGVVEGRRIFANTMKYVLMGTSSNFGNMFSAAGASALLTFLPMLPSQVLLNNLLYDTSQLAIPTDRVDEEDLARPARWNIGLVRRFMLFFGPLSSIFDFVLFGVMLWVFHASPALFRSGWFVESLATQTLVIFAIRTRRTPFVRSRSSRALVLAALAVVAAGSVLPVTPLAEPLGFTALPAPFFLALLAMVVCYLVLVDTAKRWFYRSLAPGQPQQPQGGGPPPGRAHRRRISRRAARFTTTRRAARARRSAITHSRGRAPRRG